MEQNFNELKAWQNDVRRTLERDIEQMKEELEQKINLMRLMEATGELLSEVDHLNSELQEEKEKRRLIKVVNVAGNYNDIHDNSSVTRI
jgi:bifunctional pyridoxal-dependent enzyme with beta-cystathionase and maltose regulon repressor activities